jgi:hypothetical protein
VRDPVGGAPHHLQVEHRHLPGVHQRQQRAERLATTRRQLDREVVDGAQPVELVGRRHVIPSVPWEKVRSSR